MSGHRASLIVLNYNGAGVIGPCLDSIVKAKGPDDEIIVVDNGSEDGSREMVKEREDVILVALPRNTFIFGLNEGLARATGDYVAFLNSDMTVEPDFVEECIERFADGDDVFAVCPRILQDDGREQGSRTAGYWERGLIFYKPLAHSEEPTDCFFAVGGQSFFRRSGILEIGSIDPLLWPMYHEDIELSYRAWKRGWRIRYAPKAIAHHRGGHTSKRVFTETELRSFVRQNEYLIVWKDVTDWPLLAEHVALMVPRLLAATVRGDTATLKGWVRAVSRLRQVHQSRTRARAHFRLSDREVLDRVRVR
jgi:GT2 family glycosyltransferase